MKTILIPFCFLVAFYAPCNTSKDEGSPSNYKQTGDTTINFKAQVQPILQAHCSPCHFPGGKMYEKLPFDTAQSILLKQDIVLKRINDAKENALIKKFFEQNQGK